MDMDRTRTTDFDQRPFVVIWEPTRACDLVCLHCRAAAQPHPSRFELSTEEGHQLIDQIAEMGPRVFVITGGDPLKRDDLYDLIRYSKSKGLEPALTPSATPLLTEESIAKMKEAGLSRLAVSLDGSTSAIHDAIRGVPGSFDLTIRACRWARERDLPVQINTTVSRRNLEDIREMIPLMTELDIAMWSVFFLVPTGRGKSADMITAKETEELFGTLYEASQVVSFDIKTTEAQHYRRFVLQQRMKEMGLDPDQFFGEGKTADALLPLFASGTNRKGPIGLSADGTGRMARGVNDARGFVFISHIGEVYPSGFLPLSGGNVRQQSLDEIYRHSSIFTTLRDSSLLRGKCGLCEYKEICGGSRARAYAMTGDPLQEEPLCVYLPSAIRETMADPSVAMQHHRG